MSSFCNNHFQISKNIDFRANKKGAAVFLQPDLSRALLFDVSKKTVKVLKYLKNKRASFLRLSNLINATTASEKRDLWQLLQALKKHHLVEDLTEIEALRPKNFDADLINFFSRQLTFFSSYEDKNNSRYDYQTKLLKAHVAILGLGSIGCVVLDGLARAGVGKFTLVDRDQVEPSNLTRQVLFDRDNLFKRKVTVAIRKVRKINPKVDITGYQFKVSKNTNLLKYLKNINLLIICCDEPSMEKVCDFVTPFCISKNIPYIIGGGYSAHTGALPRTIIPKKSVCWRCHKMYSKKRNKIGIRFSPSLRVSGGSLSAISGIIGNLTTLEAIKVLTGFAAPSFVDKIGELRFSNLKITSIKVKKRVSCLRCGKTNA